MKSLRGLPAVFNSDTHDILETVPVGMGIPKRRLPSLVSPEPDADVCAEFAMSAIRTT